MCDEVEVGIGDPADDLLEEKSGIVLTNIVILNVVVQLSTLGEFHNDEDVVAGVQNFVKFDYVVMVDEFEDPNFPFDLDGGDKYLRNHVFALHLAFVYYLYSHTDAR